MDVQGKYDQAAIQMRSYASIPLPRSAYHTRTGADPWLSCDPQLQDDCSAAVRAMRLILFALFALFIAPLRSEPAPAQNPDSSQAALAVGENSTKDVQLASVQNRREWIAEKRLHASKVAAQCIPSRASAEAKQQPVFLKVKRSHGPPSLAKTATSTFLRSSTAPFLSCTFAPSFLSASRTFARRLNPPNNILFLNLPSIAATRHGAQVFFVSRNLVIDHPQGVLHHDRC